jgi:hypothetical protein
VTLAERLTATNVGEPGPRCTVCALLHDLDDDDRTTLADALDGDAYTSRQIADALTAEGHAVRSGTVARHKRGDCRGIG